MTKKSNISPGYGFIECSHDDPERTHWCNPEIGEWNSYYSDNLGIGSKQFKYRKPVTIPSGWELVPEGEIIGGVAGFPAADDATINALGKGGSRWAFVGWTKYSAGVWLSHYNTPHDAVAFIRRKSDQPAEVLTYKPSDVAGAKLAGPAVDWSKPVQTRDGRKARFRGELQREDKYGHLVSVENENGFERLRFVTPSGAYNADGPESQDDIINVPEKPKRIQREVWVNVYPQAGERAGVSIYANRIAADSHAGNRIACIKGLIDCQEGDGLNK